MAEIKRNSGHQVYLSMGANLGERLANLGAALELLQARAGSVEAFSDVYETTPWGFSAGTSFLNMAVCIATRLNPLELLECCLTIESELGRVRQNKSNGYISRPIDIDLLFYEELIISTPRLKLPHPLLPQRKFVLIPLYEIAPDFKHPILNKTIGSLLSDCNDVLDVVSLGYRFPPYSGFSSANSI
jgi:2-amino-4-hydroxy-6-hydroxymethyldihydropteridine diphosphokinase